MCSLIRTFAHKIYFTVELLQNIKYPEDLRKLAIDQLPQLCQELREDIVKELSVNPGHLASSLGVVELTVALHYVYNTPEDRIVWDVGHQAYGHKILTGRREQFCTNRKLGGLKPFPSPEESEYDTFMCGHASNSISAALGMAVADKNKQRQVVAVIGDGAMSGGLAYEGLNNVSSSDNDILIILNDNNMSIDRAVGGMQEYLLSLSTNETYNALRFRASRWLHKVGLLEDDRRRGLIRLTNAVKSAISHQQNVFEGMDIRYFGPFNGHDVKALVRILKQMKSMKGPKLLHLHTQKGHGYAPAEKDVTVWHAPGRFDMETGVRQEEGKGKKENTPPRYQDVFGETLLELARQNPKIVGVTPAMPTGCSMSIMMKEMPERTFDVGIAEGHAVTFSGGMAKEGLIPFCNIYSAFAQRAYDNIIHDVAILRLNVILCLDRAGLVGEDGPTHHGAFDMAALRPIPHLTIASPMDEHELRRLMYTAQLPDKGPFIIRYPRGRGKLVDWRCPLEEIPVGKGRKLRDGEDVAVVTIGPMGHTAAEAIEELEHQTSDNEQKFNVQRSKFSIAHYDLRFLKPLDEELLHEVGRRFKKIITIEDGVRSGGMGSAVLEWMSEHGYSPVIRRLGLPDEFVEHGKVSELQAIVGIDKDSIKRAIQELL